MKRVLLVDDHEVVRNGVRTIFEEHWPDTVFGEASTAKEARELVRGEHWDAVVLDISLGEANGLDVLRDLRSIRPGLRVLVLSMYAEEQYARRALKAGAAGYITKDSSRAELAKALRKVMRGGRYVSPELAERLVVNLQGGGGLPHEALSDREFQVMQLIASGKTVTEIAEMLSLSSKTISTYRARLLEKLDLKTNAQLTRYVLENKLE